MIFRKYSHRTSVGKRTKVWFFISGLVTFALLIIPYRVLMKTTSTDRFCMSCHVHPHADLSWKLSTHHNNSSGVTVHCVKKKKKKVRKEKRK